MQLEKLRIADLRPHPMNYNKHPEKQLRELEKSLEQFDQFKNIVVCNNVIIAGHGLVEAAKRKGMTEIYALVRNDLTESQQKALLVADNATPFLAIPDTEALEELLKSIPDLSFDDMPGMTDEWLEPMDVSLDGLFDTSSSNEDDPAADEVPEVEEAITKLGELWQLGEHRLLCGDATKREDVERLLNGEKADMVFTDPPYGVNYRGIHNDDRKGLSDLLLAAFEHYEISTKHGGAVYCFHSDKCADIFNDIFRRFCHFSSMIIWVKPSLVLSQSDYHSQHEPCLYGWFLNGTHSWFSDRKQTTVWNFGKESIEGHTTPKPVDLVSNAIVNSSPKNGMVLDFFGGSGSTMIACEKTGRKCFMMELDPHYCTVIIRRWEQYTGQKAKRIET